MDYIRISEFANICGTTSRTIRFYDTVGILKADHIDPSSGYRYYAKEKVLQFHKIASLKKIGFTIEEIRAAIVGASDGDILQILKEKEKTLSEAREMCIEAISEYEGKVKMYNETTKLLSIIKDTEKNTLCIKSGEKETTIRCLARDLDACESACWDILNIPGYMNLDLKDVCFLNSTGNVIRVGYGKASGADKAVRAAEEAAKEIFDTGNLLIHARIPSKVRIEEVDAMSNFFVKNSESRNFMFGVTVSPDLEDTFEITVLNFV